MSLRAVGTNGRTFNNPTFTGTHTGDTWPFAQSGAVATAPADTNEDTLATITVPPNTLRANDSLRIRGRFTYTNNANVKTLRVRWSGGSGTQLLNVARSTQGSSHFEIIIANANSTSAQACTGIEMNAGGSFAVQSNAAAVDTTAQQTVVITGQKATNTDTLTLDYYSAEVVRV